MVISTQASNLIPLIDPSFTFPALVCLIYSPHERVHSLASGTLIALLKNYKHNPDVICLLLDYLSKPSQNPDVCDATDGVEGQKLDIDIVLNLLPEWSKMERIAGAKLLASLMASEDAVIENIFGGLVEARALLQDICYSDPSLDVRKMCQRLLVCLTSV
ncbi:hypothetical protein K7X08_008588 [Anisodus acutangulus]|uniref:Uncharacterized protein n=1 Tax=Anisodus acutangulus TaxID=402998 RepID=A0A9Q1MQP1_9SOLA|nr:hypothetical protein K7X08_008588 [Anisodus acutangulus]